MFAQIEAPGPAVRDEHLRGVVAVLGIDAARRLARAADIKAVGLGDVDVLFGVFRDAWSDDREVFLLTRSRCAAVDEGVVAGPQVRIAHDAIQHRRLGPNSSPQLLGQHASLLGNRARYEQ